jgi:methylmalonyl-CoA carboxyltransferase large subunit
MSKAEVKDDGAAAKPATLDSKEAKFKDLEARRKRILNGGGEAALKKRREKGMLNARERLDLLTDPGSFQEMNAFCEHRCTNFGMTDKHLAADGVVTGLGSIGGRQVFLASQDFTVAGGSLGAVHGNKIVEMMKQSVKCGCPFVMINDSGGARIQEGIDSLNGYGEIFYRNVWASGVVPQISLICGPCAGGASYSPALTDFIIQVRGQKMFITGPEVVKAVTGEEISAEGLGGADAHATLSGNIHFVADSDQHAFDICKKLLSFLPANNLEDPPLVGRQANPDLSEQPELDAVVPDNPREAYDVRAIVRALVDGGDFLEVMESWATNIIIGFGRVNGQSVGVVANQPMVMAGVLDINASDKGARFVRFCNAFNIPLLTLVDVPGYLPGVQQEHGGVIRHGAKLLFAYSAATTPKVTVILRKAYGGAYLAMCCKALGADRSCAWPGAEIAVMGAEGAVGIIFRKEIEAAEDKAAARERILADYRDKFANPYEAARMGMIDDVILPRQTRRYVTLALESLRGKREERPAKKHGLMPL